VVPKELGMICYSPLFWVDNGYDLSKLYFFFPVIGLGGKLLLFQIKMNIYQEP
jgi:hypothetical protein